MFRAIRRLLSFLRFFHLLILSKAKLLYVVLANSGVAFGESSRIALNANISSTDGGVIEFGDNVFIGVGCEIICRGGKISIGDNVHVGRGSIIVSTKEISIGQNSQIAEYVVVRDQDHSTSCRPIRSSGFEEAKVTIGEDCWLGTKSTVLRGSTIGNGAVIGAHGLVRGMIPPFSLAVGCPARVVKYYTENE